MTTKRKKSKSINWNLIMFIIAIAALTAAIIPSLNQQRVDKLKDKIAELQREKDELKEETEPAWYKKFNEQRTYYENELSAKEKKVSAANSTIDSLKKRPLIKSDTNHIVISINQARKILIQLAKGERDSALLEIVSEQMSLLEAMAANKDSIIFYQNRMLRSGELIEKSLNEVINIYKEEVKAYRNQIPGNRSFLNLFVWGCLLLLTCILLYLSLRKEKA